MTIKYTLPHAVATPIGGSALCYQTAVILETYAGVAGVTKWGVPLATISAAMLPVIAEAAWRQGEKAKAIMLALPVFALIAFVLPSGISRLGEQAEKRVETVTKVNGSASELAADIAAQKAKVDQAEAWMVGECKTGQGPKCKAQTDTYRQRLAYLEKLQKQAAAITPEPTPWLPTWHPALLPIGLELAVWGTFFFGFGPFTRRVESMATVAKAETQPLQALDYTGTATISDDELAELKRILRGKPKVNNKELATALGVSPGEASKRTSAAVAAGIVSRERVGKHAMISLTH